MTMTCAAANICGYFAGLSSPSVVLTTTTRASSPRSQAAGQTRLPMFSMSSRAQCVRSIFARASRTICASRWQAPRVLICTASAPAASMRSASALVSMSPSITAIRSSGRSRLTLCSSSVVLPAPGELIRLSARRPRAASVRRISAATVSLTARMFCAIVTLTTINASPDFNTVLSNNQVISFMRRGAMYALVRLAEHSRARYIAPLRPAWFDLHFKDLEFGAGNDLAAPLATRRAARDEIHDGECAVAATTARAMGHEINQQLRALQHGSEAGQHLKAGAQRFDDDAAGFADTQAHGLHARGVMLTGARLHGLNDALSNGEFMHNQPCSSL